MSRPTGPNVRKLICTRVSQFAVPKGGGIADAIGFLADKDRLLSATREATEWTFAGIDAVRAAPGCTWTTDEEIAGEILRRIGSKKPDT